MRTSAIAFLVVISLCAAHARAADPSPEEQALATTLFKEGKALLDAGNVVEACAKLGESQRIHPLGGTLLNLAVCHATQGKTATAWAEYREARVIAERDHRDERLAFIDEHMKELEPKLSKLTIEGAPGLAENVEVTVDTRAIRRPAWGVATPVDPGLHVVEAFAPGKTRWRREVTVKPDGASEKVVVHALADELVALPVTPPPPPVVVAPTLPPPDATSKVPVIIAGAVGVAGIAVGTIFGARAISKHSESDDLCTTDPCSQRSRDANDAAKTAADISTVSFAVGVVGLGVAAYFWFFSDRKNTAVHAGPGRASFQLTF